jgi:hypothetical protein
VKRRLPSVDQALAVLNGSASFGEKLTISPDQIRRERREMTGKVQRLYARIHKRGKKSAGVRADTQRQLWLYVNAWIGSGHDLGAFERAHPPVAAELKRDLIDIGRLSKKVTNPDHMNALIRGRLGAAFLFAHMLIEQLEQKQERLSRIWICGGCGRYFVALSRHRRVYCSASCGRRSTALKSISNSRDQRKENRIQLGRAGLLAWRSHSYVWQEKHPAQDFVAEYINTGSPQLPPVARNWVSLHWSEISS